MGVHTIPLLSLCWGLDPPLVQKNKYLPLPNFPKQNRQNYNPPLRPDPIQYMHVRKLLSIEATLHLQRQLMIWLFDFREISDIYQNVLTNIVNTLFREVLNENFKKYDR